MMIENQKARWAIILVVLAMCIVYALPNFVKVGQHSLLPNKKMIYGLDIQGGLQLVMGVDVNGVIQEKAQRMTEALATEAKDQGVPVAGVKIQPQHNTWLNVTLRSPEQMAAFKKFINDYYGTTLQIVEEQGKTVTLRIYDAKIREYKKQVVDQAIEVIRNRIDEFGVASPSIAAQGEDRIMVQLPGIKDSEGAKELINKTAKLSFEPVVDTMKPSDLQKLVTDAETKGGYALGKNKLRYRDYIKRLNADLKAKLPAHTMVVFEKNPAAKTIEAGKVPYLVRTDSHLSGGELEDASVRPDEYGKPEVVFRFSVEGRREFAQLTEQNVGKQVAIILDDIVQSAPQIREKINSPTARITLGSEDYQSAEKEAKLIATALRAGALPAALQQLSERTVGATLGADSIARGILAGIVGAILVFGFMLFHYRFLGIVADLALAFNILMSLAVLSAMGATLTLPGVAGIALTIGVAVDANVLVFERIREEMAKGASIKGCIHDGFRHAFSAILDSHVTSAVTSSVLIYYGTGPIRGFGVTLLIGIIASMFTAVFVSRSMVEFATTRLGVKKLI